MGTYEVWSIVITTCGAAVLKRCAPHCQRKSALDALVCMPTANLRPSPPKSAQPRQWAWGILRTRSVAVGLFLWTCNLWFLYEVHVLESWEGESLCRSASAVFISVRPCKRAPG